VPGLALFDLDDTLTGSSEVPFRAAIGEFAIERGLSVEDVHWLTVEAVHYWSDDDPYAYFRAVVRKLGLAEDPHLLYEAYRSRYLAAVKPLDGVIEGLTALRDAGWRTGIVTNGPVRTQLAKIERLQLPALVDAICISEAENCWKPEAEIFRRAAEKAGASLDGAWMTGDSLDADIAGGNALGLTTAWVRLGRDRPAEAPVPTHLLKTTAEVFSLILGHAA
jgi:FMN phosphatase YigB (HAD superfamily)